MTQSISRLTAARLRRILGLLTLLLAALLVAAAPVAAQDAPAEVTNPDATIPTLLMPEDNAVVTGLTHPPVGMPTLQWVPVAGATRYNVQVSASVAFANVLDDKTTAVTSYTPLKTLADGEYYWRVRVEVDRAWSLFSPPYRFTKNWSAGGALVPQLLDPPHDPQSDQPIANFTPDHFRWEPVPGAATYLLEISSTDSFNNPTDKNGYYSAETIEPRHTPIYHFRNGLYYWRVTPRDNQGNAGGESDVRVFRYLWDEAPILRAPISNPLHEAPVELRFLPRFSWDAVRGASSYRLEVSTEQDFNSLALNVTTTNTDYTPETALPNNKDYYWRVKAIRTLREGTVTGPAGEVRRFTADWVDPPQLLTPADFGAQHTYPYFSWTPVAGAEKYRIKIRGPEVNIEKTLTNATAYTQPEWRTLILDADYYWQVQAIDARGNTTDWTAERQFRFIAAPPPNLIYPEHHYIPDAEGMPVHTDRTIAYPLFVWDTTHAFLGGNGPENFLHPDSYKIEVATDASFFAGSVLFSMQTAGQAVAPTVANPFNNLIDGALYHWRVTPYREGVPLSLPSTAWPIRIDRNVPQLPIATDGSMIPLYPAPGFVSVAIPPVLGWQPVANAHHYRVEISRNAGFTDIVDGADALFANYVPWQGRLQPMPFGAYWWRVQARQEDNTPLTGWSQSRHFILSQDLMVGSQFDYQVPKGGTLMDDGPLYDPALSRLAGSDGSVTGTYGLGGLHLIDDRSVNTLQRNWVLAFEVEPSITGAVDYAIYIDVNHRSDRGGTSDPRQKLITIAADSLFKPEHVIYVSRTDNTVDATAWLYRWDGGGWQGAVAIHGVTFDPVAGVIQIIFDYTAILRDIDLFGGSLAVTVVSSPGGLGTAPQATIPPQPMAGRIDNPALASGMLTPLFPFDTPLSNPTVYHELPSFRWRMPHFNSNDGYEVQVARDILFTTVFNSWSSTETGTGSFYSAIPTAFRADIAYTDEESYYWRVRRRHERYVPNNAPSFDVGPWSPPMRLKLSSYQVGDPRTSLGDTSSATPAFLWERVEGAAGYTIQISSDSKFGSFLYNKKIDANSFVPTTTLPDGVFYWRVAMRRSSSVQGQWTDPVLVFNKVPMTTTLISPLNGVVINHQPTFVWSPVYTNTGELRMAAPRYRLQWSTDPTFSNRPSSIETYATSYTLPKGQSLDDGTWHWRVTVIDGSGRLGANSESGSFYKEYLPPPLVSPQQGELKSGEVEFVWSPIEGAAAYDIEIADNDAFNRPVVRATTTDQTRFTPLVLLQDKEYYWRVRLRDKDGRVGPFVLGRFSSQLPTNLPYAVQLPYVTR